MIAQGDDIYMYADDMLIFSQSIDIVFMQERLKGSVSSVSLNNFGRQIRTLTWIHKDETAPLRLDNIPSGATSRNSRFLKMQKYGNYYIYFNLISLAGQIQTLFNDINHYVAVKQNTVCRPLEYKRRNNHSLR